MTRTAGGGRGRGRLAAIALLAAALAGGALAATVSARRAPGTALQPAGLAAEAAPIGSVSSIWYCPGGPEHDGVTTQLLLANAAGRAVRAAVLATDASGAQGRRTLRLQPHSVSVMDPASLVGGAWLASSVEVAGGAVSATELVDGRSGRSVVQCASGASGRWYFASGSTRTGSTLDVTVANPTRALAVVDLTFVTASGFTAPAPFQGLVVEPGALRVLTVGTYVQDQASVASVVAARSGAVVAGEVQSYGAGGGGGVAPTLGVPAMSPRWVLPSVEDAVGGASELAMFNPSGQRERVVVDVRLPAGPVQPFTQELGPESVWTLTTSDELRIADQEPYTVEVHATGPGVVVERSGSGAPHGPAPWRADDVAVSWLEASATHRWMVAGQASAALPSTWPKLVVENPSRQAVRAEVTWWPASGTSSGRAHVRELRLAALAHASITLPIGLAVVRADGPIAVVGDASPPGAAGAIGIPAVPLR